jgi:hypothetical protein
MKSIITLYLRRSGVLWCWQKTKERKRNVLVSTQGREQEMLPEEGILFCKNWCTLLLKEFVPLTVLLIE